MKILLRDNNLSVLKLLERILYNADHMTKPFNPDMMLTRIKKVLIHKA